MVDDDAEEEHVDVDVEDAGNKTGGEVEVVAVPDAVTHLGRLGPRQVQCGRALCTPYAGWSRVSVSQADTHTKTQRHRHTETDTQDSGEQQAGNNTHPFEI